MIKNSKLRQCRSTVWRASRRSRCRDPKNRDRRPPSFRSNSHAKIREDQAPREGTGVDRAKSSRLGRLLRRRHVQSHPRLFGAGAAAILLYFLLPGWTTTATRFLIAFNGGEAARARPPAAPKPAGPGTRSAVAE